MVILSIQIRVSKFALNFPYMIDDKCACLEPNFRLLLQRNDQTCTAMAFHAQDLKTWV